MTTSPTPEGTPVNPEHPADDAVTSHGDDDRLAGDVSTPTERLVGTTEDGPAAETTLDPTHEESADTAPEEPGAAPEEPGAAPAATADEGPAGAAGVDDEPSVDADAPATATPHPLAGWSAAEVPWDVATELGEDAPYVPTQAAPDPAPVPSTVPIPQGAPVDVDRLAEVASGAPDASEPAESAPATGGPVTGRPDTERPHGRPDTTESTPTPPTPTSPTGPGSSGGWSKLGRAMRPTVNRSQLLAGLLCALLGFALAVQVSQTQEEQLSSLRQSDLVRLLDDVTQRANELEARVSTLQETRDELSSGSGQQRAALELAQRQAESQGILSGRLPAEGPGIELTITEGDRRIPASKLFNILEELRNAGVEVVEVNGVRLVTSSYFEETSRGMVVDGQSISSPYRWKAIGDPSTLETALEIPGGAMSSVRNEGAEPVITQQDLVTITSTREPQAPQFATPVPVEGGD